MTTQPLTRPRVVEVTPADLQARIIRQLLASRYPKLELPTIAAQRHMPLDELQTLLRYHGYPERQALQNAAVRLEAGVVGQEDADEPADDVGPPVAPEAEHLADVALADLQTDPSNPREELRHGLDELADSIAEVGLLQPIVARRHNGQLIVVAGHRRLAAVQHLGWKTVPTIIRGDMKPDHVLAAMLVENGQRRDLNPIEEARGLRRLQQQLDCTMTEVARRVGRSDAHVSTRMALLELSLEEQQQIIDGEMLIRDGVTKGRINAGTHQPNQTRGWHLGIDHPLATAVKDLCNQLGHPGGRRLAKTGCGSCWETVIRADERGKA